MPVVAWIFWIAVGLIIYSYIAFPILLALRAALLPKRIKRGSYVPTVSIIIATHNEADFITSKLNNVFSLAYPGTHLEVIVASDGSTDQTEEIVQRYTRGEVRLLVLPKQGRNRTLNAAVSASRGEVLFFTDVETILDRDALLNLIAPFDDPNVGAAEGDYRYMTGGRSAASENGYWNCVRLWKWLQSRSGSMTSATGQIFAIRRSLFHPIPERFMDDFYISMQAAAAHKRLIFEPRAIAYCPISSFYETEFDRKVRITTDGLRTVLKMRCLLNPLQYGFYALQLLTDKVLRRLLFVPFFLIFFTAPLLWNHGTTYQLATVGQLALHTLAGIGYLLRDSRLGRFKVFELPMIFDMVNCASAVAVTNLARGTRKEIWKPQRTATATTPPRRFIT